MTTRNRSFTLALVLVGAVVCSTVVAEPLSDTGEYDIGVLMDEARQLYDFEAEDAVVLLYQERRLWTADERRIREIHRIVWIRTSRGIRSYADLRVPWDSARQELTATTLRSWRPKDQRWTTSGPTAVVETTPYAFGHAVDYTNIRETMLLHDGVELPCILETRYRIEDHEAYAGGMQGVHAVAQGDPALISELVLGAPSEASLTVNAVGVDAPETGVDGATGLHLRTYAARALEPLPSPRPAATEVAHVAWSTWPDRQALGEDLTARLDGAATLDEPSRAAAAKATEEARSPIETAEMLAAWVGEATTFVDYDRIWFVQPRPAHRTWSTAYAHALDRAVLAAATFRNSGFRAGPAYRKPHGVPAAGDVPTLTLLEGPLLWVSGEGFDGIYDPTDSSLAVGAPVLSGDDLWRLGEVHEKPAPEVGNRAVLRLDLKWNDEDSTWQGTGMLRAGGTLSPFARMQGLEAGRSQKVLEGLAASVLEGAEVSALNFERFAPEAVHAGFALTVKGGERDTQDRVRLEIGDPSPSLNDPLHAAGPLYQTTRDSSVYLHTPLEVVVEVHLDTADLGVVSLPVPAALTNDAGTFQLDVEQSEDGLYFRRRVRVDDAVVAADEWPQIRALLLAATSPKNHTLLLQ